MNSSRQPTLLVVEDEPATRQLLKLGMKSSGWKIIEAGTGKLGMRYAREHQSDLMILDLGLPDVEGLDVIRDLRTWSRQPIIILSARCQEQHIIEALDAGADDYLTKPFRPSELEARIRALLRRAANQVVPEMFQVGMLRIDLARKKVFLTGEEITLTQREFGVLKLLVKNAGRVVSQRTILEQVWGDKHSEDSTYVRIYIARLRNKLEADPTRPIYFLTESGIGYKLVDSLDEETIES
jgi:two-component system KDP operon response regulator KdpE